MARNLKSQAPATDTAPGEHDAWVRSEVEKTLRGLKDGSVGLISEDEHDRRWREKRAAMWQRPEILNDEASLVNSR